MGSLRRWLKARLGLTRSNPGENPPQPINLLDDSPEQIEAPALAGLDLEIHQRPWSVSRLAAIFRNLQRTPTPDTVQAGRQARHCLSCFWLTAPVDQLEALYGGAIGDLQRQELEGPLPHQPLASDERQWRDALVMRLGQADQASQRLNLLLAVMPYFSPSSLSVEDPVDTLPRWFLHDYVIYCEPDLRYQLDGPAGLLEPSVAETPGSDAVLVEPFSQRRGEEAMAWFRDEQALSRMQALVNLYSLDPEDQGTLQELAVLRRVVAQLWLDVEPSQLQTLYGTPVGLLTRSLITAGFGKELLNEDDQRARKQLAPLVADLTRPKALSALLAVLMFYPAGQIEVADAKGIPGWLLEELRGL